MQSSEYLELVGELTALADLAHSKVKAVGELLEGLNPNNVTDYPLLVEVANRKEMINATLNDILYQTAVVEGLRRLSFLNNKTALNNETLESNHRYLITMNITTVYLPISPVEGDTVSLVLARGFNKANATLKVEGQGVNQEIMLDETFKGKVYTYHKDSWLTIENPWDTYERYDSGVNSRGAYRITPDTIEQFLEVRPGETAEWPLEWPDNYEITSTLISRQPRDTANNSGYTLEPGNRQHWRPDITAASSVITGNISDICKFKTSPAVSNDWFPKRTIFISSEEGYTRSLGGTMQTYFEPGVSVYEIDPSGSMEEKIFSPTWDISTLGPVSAVASGNACLFVLESGWDPSDEAAGKTPSHLRVVEMGDYSPSSSDLSSLTSISTKTLHGHRLDAITFNTTDSHALVGITAHPARYGVTATPNDAAEIFVYNSTEGPTKLATMAGSKNTTGVKCFEYNGFGWVWFTESGSNTTELAQIDPETLSVIKHVVTLPPATDGRPEAGYESPEIFYYEGSPYLIALHIEDRTQSKILKLNLSEAGALEYSEVSFSGRESLITDSTDNVRHFFHGENDYLAFTQKEEGIKIGRVSGTTDTLTITFGEEVYYPYINEVEPIKVAGNTLLALGLNSREELSNVVNSRAANTEIALFSDRLAKLDAIVTGIRDPEIVTPT